MAYNRVEAEQIRKTLEFINFVPFHDGVRFKSEIPDFLKLKYGDENKIKVRSKIYFRVLNYLYLGYWNLDEDKYEELINEARKPFGVAVLKEKSRNKTSNIEGDSEDFFDEALIAETKIIIND